MALNMGVRLRAGLLGHRFAVPLLAAAVVPLVLVTACTAVAPAGQVAVVTGTGKPRFPVTPGPGSQALTEAGSTLLLPLLQKWATAYHSLYPRVRIATAGGGSGQGIDDASAGTVSLGASDAYLSSGQMVENPRLLNIPLAVSAQQIYYNLPSLAPGTHLKLDAQVLAEMYEGQITSWNAPAIAHLNPGVRLPGLAVVPLHRSDPTGSGDTFLFTSYLSAKDAFWSSHYGYGTLVRWPAISGPGGRHQLGLEGNPAVVAGCHATPGCVAYVGLSYARLAAGDRLGEAALQNRSGNYELPSDASIPAAVTPFISSTPPNETISMIDGPDASGYPIVNYEYAIVSTRQHSPAAARDLRAFLHWIITSGQSRSYLDGFAGPLPPSIPGFQPLPSSVAALSDAQIAKIS
jgi:phosphate transport system substrate-binding protein